MCAALARQHRAVRYIRHEGRRAGCTAPRGRVVARARPLSFYPDPAACAGSEVRVGRATATMLAARVAAASFAALRSISALLARHRFDSLSDPLSRGLDLAVSDMGVAHGHADVAVPEQAGDHG